MVCDLYASFLLAVQFLTIVPVRSVGAATPARMARATTWFPVVGLLLGGVLALVDVGLRAVLPPLVSAGLLLGLWVALTGALHLDGFLDACDALLAARSPRERLEILRDVHAGSFAIVGGICLLIVKFALLAELPTTFRAPTLLVVPALSRAAVVYAVRAFPYARPGGGLGSLFRERLAWTHVTAAAAVAVVAASIALGWIGLAAAAFVWLATVTVALWVRRRIPGLTGDVYGAVNELAEVGGLLVVLLIAGAL
jgi:adenosylcobinamide-GDP ribazoletransferase